MSSSLRVFLRSLRLIAISVWFGSLIFFAFVVAPVAFSPAITSQTHSLVVPGAVVAGSLRALHWIGLACGAAFAGSVLWLRRRWRMEELLVVVVMMLLTAFSQFWIMPRMERDRVQVGGDIDAAAFDNPQRLDFEWLHPLSEKVEGGVMLGGLALIVLMAAESSAKARTIE